MRKHIWFIVPGTPKGKARARTFFNKRLDRMQSITPENTMLYENLIRMTYTHKFGKVKIEAGVPVEITIVASFEPPASASKTKRRKMLEGAVTPTKKPDIDNIAKVALDALNGLAFYDDAQITGLIVSKRYAEEASLSIGIDWEVEEENDTV